MDDAPCDAERERGEKDPILASTMCGKHAELNSERQQIRMKKIHLWWVDRCYCFLRMRVGI